MSKRRMPIFPVGAVCHYCLAEATTWDHIVPKAQGGTDGSYNLVPACVPCNDTKAIQLPTCGCDKCRGAVRRWRRLNKKRGELLRSHSFVLNDDIIIDYQMRTVSPNTNRTMHVYIVREIIDGVPGQVMGRVERFRSGAEIEQYQAQPIEFKEQPCSD